MASPPAPQLRLLFDENLPWRVASALQVLGCPVTYVGDDNASPPSPKRGSTDFAVIEHAKRFNQIIVTYNLDMILLCVELNQPVIWIDPRGLQLRRKDVVLIVFKNLDDWALRVGDGTEPVCIHAMRSKSVTLQLDEAGRLARDRMSRIARKKARARPIRPHGDLFTDS